MTLPKTDHDGVPVRTYAVHVLKHILLLICGSFLFALSNPGFIFPRGLGFIAWFAYIPMFVLIRRASFKTVWLYGFVYGVLSYALYVSWLVIFSPVGSIAIEAQYGVLLLLTFVLIKTAYVLFPEKGWLVGYLVFCAYEYAKTIGFAGFSYGVTAYTQWKNPLLIQCADLFGVWGLSALVVFPSAWIAELIRLRASVGRRCVPHAASAAVWFCCLVCAVIYGAAVRKDYSTFPTVKVAAVQHNTDPWVGGMEAYRRDVADLMRLSDEALASDPDIKLVVWPETSVVPSVIRHYTMRPDRSRFELIKQFLTYVDSKNAVFVVGNDHSVMKQDGSDTEDWNAVLVFTPGKNVLPPDPGIYRKIRLVPFTESFPWPEQFPGMYQALLNGDTHLWSQGHEPVVFHEAGMSFSTPICFEDTFGDGCRNMFNNGARALVNLSNDAWSKSLSCQYQHLAMAVFRCVENRIPAVRSTASGQTCIVDPNGKVVAMAKEFTQTLLTGQLPVIPDDVSPTLYDRAGDILGKLFVLMAAAVLAAGCVLRIRSRVHG